MSSVPEVSIDKTCIEMEVGVSDEIENSTSNAVEIVFLATETDEVWITRYRWFSWRSYWRLDRGKRYGDIAIISLFCYKVYICALTKQSIQGILIGKRWVKGFLDHCSTTITYHVVCTNTNLRWFSCFNISDIDGDTFYISSSSKCTTPVRIA